MDERKAFCDILVDPDDDFAYKLERLALNKSSNRELFEEMQVKFAKILRENSFIEMNNQNFKLKDGKIKEYEPLDITIDKLRVQYKKLRVQWSAIASETKTKSGLSPKTVPEWYNIVNPVFSEYNKIKLGLRFPRFLRLCKDVAPQTEAIAKAWIS